MFGSTVLEVAIGLVFFFLLLSLAFTALNELMAGLLSKRSENLRKGIGQLLQDSQQVRALYNHPLIKSLSPKGKKPSYIPSETFALSLLSTLAGSITDCKQLCDKLAEDPDEAINRQLLPLIQCAQGDLSKAVKSIERWFDDSMNRISGTYKRWTMYITFIIAFVVSSLINADAIMVAKLLWSDTSLRAGVTAAAGAYASKESADTSTSGSDSAALVQLAEALDQVQAANFPIGWTSNVNNSLSKNAQSLRTFPPALTGNNTFGWWLNKFLGIMFTVLAVTLGAPFWFDLLNKIVKVRAAGSGSDVSLRTEQKP